MKSSRPKRCALHLDGLANQYRLSDPIGLEKTVRTIAKAADMNVMSISVQNVGMEAKTLGRVARPWESGYSVQGLIVKAALTSSHITIHAWPEHEFFMFDIVSCQSFNREGIRGLLMDLLHVGEVIEEYQK